MCNHLVLILLPCATFVITKINNLFLVQNTKCILNYAKLVKKGRVIHEDARHNKDSQCKQQVKSQKKMSRSITNNVTYGQISQHSLSLL